MKNNWNGIARNGTRLLSVMLSFASVIGFVGLWSIPWGALPVSAVADDLQTGEGITRRIELPGPDNASPISCDIVQVLDTNGEPTEYTMDVDSVVCGDKQCEIVTVRLHFDPLGDYQRYELPFGGKLTKRGHKPFSRADHEKLQQILSNPYSELKSVAWDQITMPSAADPTANDVDGISGATALTKRKMVVMGAAYTCYTLWHWSHGQVEAEIREMTVRASDRQDLLRYLHSEKEKYIVFATDQLRTQGIFDGESITAVRDVLRDGSEKVADATLRYLADASSETGDDQFYNCCMDECMVANSLKRVRYLEALRENTQPVPPEYVDQLSSWLARADGYYEVHLLLSLFERGGKASDLTVAGAMSQLESQNSLVVCRCYQYLKTQQLDATQLAKLQTFEREHPEKL